MGEQKLSARGARDKAIRDLEYANSEDRKTKRADSERKRRKAVKEHGSGWLRGKDYDHNSERFTSTKHNRGGTQSRNKKDGTKAEKNNK
jgi:hypothetical protein